MLFNFLKNLAVVFLCILFSNSSFAATRTWVPTSAGTYDFNTAVNWSGGVAPTSADDVVFNSPTHSQTISFSADATVNSLKMLNTNSPATINYTLNLSGYTLNVIESGSLTSFLDLTAVLATGTGTFTVNTTSATLGYIKIDKCDFSSSSYSLSLTCPRTVLDRSLTITASLFGGTVYCEAKRDYIQGCTFSSSGSFTFRKKDVTGNTGNTTNYDDINGCTFSGTFTLYQEDIKQQYLTGNTYTQAATFTNSNTSAGAVLMAGTSAFASTADFYNTGTGSITIGGTATFNAATTFTNSSTGALVVSSTLTDLVSFNSSTTRANVYFNNTGANPGYIRISDQGEIDFNNSYIVIGNNSTGQVRIGHNVTSTKLIKVSATSLLTVYPDNVTSGGLPYMNGGSFYIDRLWMDETTEPINISTGMTVNLNFGCTTNNLTQFHRPVNLTFYKCTYLAGEFIKATTITLLDSSPAASLNTQTCNFLTFDSDITITNKSSADWYLGGNATAGYTTLFRSTGGVRSQVTVENQGAGTFYFCYNPGNTNFNGVDLKFVRHSTVAMNDPGNISVGYVNALAIITMDAYATLNISQSAGEVVSGGTKGIYLGKITSATFNFIVYGKVKITDITKGLLWFGGGFTAKAVANPTSVGLTDDVNLLEVIDAYVSTAYRYIYFGNYGSGPVFEKKVNMASYEIADYQVTFKDDVYLRLLKSTGGKVWIVATFEKDAILQMDGPSSSMRFGYSAASIMTFNGNLTVRNYGPGSNITLAENGTVCTIKGDLTWLGSQGQYIGYSPGPAAYGTITFNGTTDQKIITGTAPATTLPDGTVEAAVAGVTKLGFYYLEVNKPSGKLIINNNVYINNSLSSYNSVLPRPRLKLTNGNIVTSASALITIADNSVCEGGGKFSFVEGPLAKVGDDGFKFYIGKPGKYFPVSLAAPSTTTASFTAEFFDGYQPNAASLNSNLGDAVNCQYWKIDKTGTSTAADVTLFWNNDPTQACYPINHNIVCVARFNGTNWENEGSNVLNDYQPADSGYVKSTTGLTSYGYFALGYRNALVLNTVGANPSLFKVLSHTEPFTSGFTSGPLGTLAGDKTILSSINNVAGKVVIHPDFGAQVDVTIDQASTSTTSTDARAVALTYESLNLKLYTNASGATPACTLVTANEDGVTFNPLSDQYYSKSGNNLNFYKQRQEDNVYVLANSLADGITFPVSTTGTTTPFQITNVPSGAAAVLSIYNLSSGTSIYSTSTNPLSWDGKVSGVNVAEGVYRYTLLLTVASIPYTYNGQLIVKYQ